MSSGFSTEEQKQTGDDDLYAPPLNILTVEWRA
jgi:hypothetical protein